MIFKRLVLFTLFAGPLASTVCCQSFPASYISRQEALKDIDVFYNTLKESHPALFLYTTRADFDTAVTSLKNSIPDSIECLALYRKLVRFNDLIRCVHSDIRPPDTYQEWFDTGAKFLPVNIMAVGDMFYVSENMSGNDTLKYGTRVIAINNIPVAYTLREILPAIPSDGFNTTRKYDAIRSNFNRYFTLLFGQPEKRYRITVMHNGKHTVIEHPGLTKHEFLSKRTKKTTPPVELEFIPDKQTALLRVRTFRHDLLANMHIDFRRYLDSCFQTIRSNGSEYLIIDLRDNHGGYSEYGATLLEYISPVDFTYCTKLVTTGKIPDRIKLDVAETFKDFPSGLVFENNEYRWPGHSILGTRKRSNAAFNGTVFFLVNGGGVSTTAECVSVAQFYNMGIFIGEPVGGYYKGDNGGVLGYLKLPHSGINIRIAMVQYVLPGADSNGAFARIDHEVLQTIGQIRNGEDVQLRHALYLIDQNNGNSIKK